MDRAFAAITDHLVDAMYLVELDGSVVYGNPAAKRLFGEATHVTCPAVLEALKTKTRIVNVPTSIIREGQASIFLLASAAPIVTRQGETPHWVVTYHDITPQQEEEQRRSYFLSIAGHEIKNPLATIRAVAQTVERKEKRNGNDAVVVAMGKIIGKVDFITHLINDLMDINRLRSDELEYFDEVFDLQEFITNITSDFSRMFPQRELRCEGETSGFIEIDRIRLSQVFLNLLANAAKHTPSGVPITLSLTNSPSSLECRISDGGTVIPFEEREHLFDLTYQVPGKQKARPGLGLGLYITRLILEHYNGKIWIEEGEQGSFFAFSLPRRQVTRLT